MKRKSLVSLSLFLITLAFAATLLKPVEQLDLTDFVVAFLLLGAFIALNEGEATVYDPKNKQ